MDLSELRQQIDTIDNQIIQLFEKRMEVAEGVARYKIGAGKPVLDTEREKQKIAAVRAKGTSEFNRQGLESVFNQIMSVSRMRQYALLAEQEKDVSGFCRTVIGKQPARVVYQGVEGAYQHQAMLGYFGEAVNGYHVENFEDVMTAVESGEAEFGVLPLENTSTGIITDVYDLLERHDNCIIGEYVVKVEHALLGLSCADISDIKAVYSHPQGLFQCGNFLDTVPEWEQFSLKNTAVSAMKVLRDQDVTQAAIASEKAADYYGLKVLQSHINDNDNNSTRFIIIQHKKEYTTEADCISITFEIAHESGSLFRVLEHIIFNGLNMSKIESRPIQGEKWRYRFFIDFDGNLGDEAVRDALKGIETETADFKILGNYIKAE